MRKFVPQRKNANKHTQRGMRLLEESLQRDGWIDAQTAAADGEIISGSARLEVAAEKFAGVEPIIVESDGRRPVIVVRTDIPSADDPRARRLSVAANQIAHVDYDPDGDLLMEWANEDKEVRKMFADDEWAELVDEEPQSRDAEPQIDRAEELRVKWGVETGQLWQVGKHRLICGDCTDAAVVARVMGGEKAALVFTDPPYGVAIGDKNRFLNLNSFQRAGRNSENISGDKLDADALYSMLLPAFTLMKQHIHDFCSVYVTSPQGGELGLMMMMMMKDSGLPVRHVLNWVKNQPTFSMGRLDYEYQHEPILYTWYKSHKFYGEGKHMTSTWHIDKPRASKEHPTMKPVELVENAVLNSSAIGDVVLDPFCGSGTTMVACQNLGRRCYGIEIEPRYVAVTLERMAQAFPEIEIKLSNE